MSSRVQLGLALVALLSLAACAQENDLGQYCFIGADGCALMTPSCPTNNPECQSGICFKQGGYKCVDGAASCADDPSSQLEVQPICTKPCQASGDCGASGGGVNVCSAYVCQAQQPESGYDVPCLCVCLDYVRNEDGFALTREDFEAGDLACR